MKTPKITVITPTYNRAVFLSETIESVLRQSYKDFEYYIIDDGSTDKTKEIVKPYLKDKRVKYFYHKNQGEAETVNWGWSMAKSEYFTQVNSDDPILPGLFSEMVKVLDSKKDIVVAYTDFYYIDDKGNTIKKSRNVKWNFLEAISSFSCYAASPGTFIRKSSFKSFNIIRDKKYKYIGDAAMYWKMALYGDFYYLPNFLASWRVHSGGISNTRYKSIPEIEEWYKEYFSNKNLTNELLLIKNKTRLSLYIYYTQLLGKSLSITNIFRIVYYKFCYIITRIKMKSRIV